MSFDWKWKSSATLIGILVCVYLLAPSFFDFRGVHLPPSIESLFPKKGLNLGLDLRGGLYLEMDVDLAGAVGNRVDIILSDIERQAEKFSGIKLTRDESTNHVRVDYQGNKEEFLSFLQTNYESAFERVQEEPLTLQLTSKYRSYLETQTLKQAQEAVRNRIDRFGVAEAGIQQQGASRLIVELPGVKDPDRVIEVVRKTGQLEFKIVDDSIPESQVTNLVSQARTEKAIPEGYSKEITDQLNVALAGKIPEDSEIHFSIVRDPITKNATSTVPYLVKKRAEVTGDMLRNAQVGIDRNQPYVSLSFNKIGARMFGEVTKNNVKKQLAIVLDDLVESAPVIQTAILDGEAQITLGFGTYQALLREAEDLSLVLREGALPAALTIASKTVIGPSLGADSIKMGLKSLWLAAVVVFLFMIFYYQWGGVVANVALVLNVLFIFGSLAVFQASLTLPGIAGIVLTMGMAVDANIIIYERMREEKVLGKTAKAIVESGYGNAMSAILDSNITTLISGIILFQFGTGPIKGFATTLMIGIITTLFTAVVVTRLIYDYFLIQRKVAKVI